MQTVAEAGPLHAWLLATDSVWISTRKKSTVHKSAEKSASPGSCCFPCYSDKPSLQEHLRGKILFWLTAWGYSPSTRAEKSQWQENEADGHFASTVKKRKAVNACAHLTFSFLNSGPQPRDWCHPQEAGFLISINFLEAHLPGDCRSQVDNWD